MKAYHGQAWWWGMAVLLSMLLTGCFTAFEVTDTSSGVYTPGYSYYWGWYGQYYPWTYWYPYYNVYSPYGYNHYWYNPPHRIHVPSYYEKYPQHKPKPPVIRDGGRRDFGNTRQPGDVRHQNPLPPKQQYTPEPRTQSSSPQQQSRPERKQGETRSSGNRR